MHISHNVAVGPLQDYFARSNGRPADVGQYLLCDDAGVRGRYSELHLRSVFQPILDAATLEPRAHEALLRAKLEDGGEVSPQAVFHRPSQADEVVFLDRLCRTVHALNFSIQADPGDVLYLNVDGRHLTHIEGGTHGRTFENLLQHCGLVPGQIVLEILESNITDEQRLAEAVAAYRQRGYRIAIDDFGCSHSNFDRLWKLTPDIVKLDRGLLLEADANPRARIILPKLVEMLHDLGALVVCEGIETHGQHKLASDAGVDLVQGFLYARPQPLLLRERRDVEALSG